MGRLSMQKSVSLMVTARSGNSITVRTSSKSRTYQNVLMGHTCGNNHDPLKVGDVVFVLNRGGDDISVRLLNCNCAHLLYDLAGG
jgi:hypothetical protein